MIEKIYTTINLTKKQLNVNYDLLKYTRFNAKSDFLANYIRVHLPYLIRKLDDGSYIPLNRYYKPLGFTDNDWYDYDKFKQLTVECVDITGLKTHGEPFTSGWFYNDGTTPWGSKEGYKNYKEKLKNTFWNKSLT